MTEFEKLELIVLKGIEQYSENNEGQAFDSNIEKLLNGNMKDFLKQFTYNNFNKLFEEVNNEVDYNFEDGKWYENENIEAIVRKDGNCGEGSIGGYHWKKQEFNFNTTSWKPANGEAVKKVLTERCHRLGFYEGLLRSSDDFDTYSERSDIFLINNVEVYRKGVFSDYNLEKYSKTRYTRNYGINTPQQRLRERD